MNWVEGLYGDGRVGVEMLIRTAAEKGLRKGTWVKVAQRAPRSGRQNLDPRARAGILGRSGATSWRHSGPTNKRLPLNILVIEDRDVNRKLVCDFLQSQQNLPSCDARN